MVVEATFSGQRVADLAQTERESLVGHDSRARTGPARYALRAVSAEVRSRGEGRRGRGGGRERGSGDYDAVTEPNIKESPDAPTRLHSQQ